MYTQENETGLGGRKERQARRAKRKDKRSTRRTARKAARPAKKAKRKSRRKKVFNKLKTAFGAGPRGAFLGLVALNAVGLASLLNIKNNTKISQDKRNAAKIKYDEIAKKWYNLGGNRTTLQRTVINGAKRKALGSNLPGLKKLKFVQDLRSSGIISGISRQPYSIGTTGAEEIVAAVTAAAPVIAALSGLLGTLAAILPKKGQQGYDPDMMDEGPLLEENDEGYGDDGDDDGFMMQAGAGLVGVAILAALFIGTKKSKK